jgi:hypothetical protein
MRPLRRNDRREASVRRTVNELIETEQNTQRMRTRRFRRVCGWTLAVLLVACGVAVRVAPMNVPMRLLLAGTFLLFIFTCLAFLFLAMRKPSVAVFPAIFFLLLFVLWDVVGSKAPDAEALRQVYYYRLQAYIGTPFRSGGETDLGVDCSGLARAALWQAMSWEGVKEFNPRLLGTELWQFWWRDLSAADIADGKYGYARTIGHAPKLAGYDTTYLEVGDMAVAGKSHVMIYYGSEQWIEASPVDGRVVVIKAPASSRRRYFNVPVKLVRWRILED